MGEYEEVACEGGGGEDVKLFEGMRAKGVVV